MKDSHCGIGFVAFLLLALFLEFLDWAFGVGYPHLFMHVVGMTGLIVVCLFFIIEGEFSVGKTVGLSLLGASMGLFCSRRDMLDPGYGEFHYVEMTIGICLALWCAYGDKKNHF